MSTVNRISREDFYKLNGLLLLAREHNKALETIVRAAAQITGDEPDEVGGGFYLGHTSDAIAEGYSAAELLAKLGIEVEPDGEPA